MKKVAYVASECVPFIKTGGLADVVGTLPKIFDRNEYDVRVIMPNYLCIPNKYREKMQYITHFYMDIGYKNDYVGVMYLEYEGVKVYFIDNEYYFNGPTPYGDVKWDIEKFCYFSKAALSILPSIGFQPDIIHCHDWQTGMVPVFLKYFYGEINPYTIESVLKKTVSDKDKNIFLNIHFIDNNEKISMALVDILYLLRCSLMHGEVLPDKNSIEVYKYAYEILAMILKKMI